MSVRTYACSNVYTKHLRTYMRDCTVRLCVHIFWAPGEVAGHYREEVRRLGEGVRPHRKVPASSRAYHLEVLSRRCFSLHKVLESQGGSAGDMGVECLLRPLGFDPSTRSLGLSAQQTCPCLHPPGLLPKEVSEITSFESGAFFSFILRLGAWQGARGILKT